jgi:undecaprenyl-diphosphatase
VVAVAGLERDFVEGAHEFLVSRPGLADAVELVTLLGGTPARVLVTGAVVALAILADRIRLGVFAVVVSVSSVALNHALKAIVDRERPRLVPALTAADGASFPSGHAMNAVATLGAAAIVVALVAPQWRRVAWMSAAALAGAIGASRVALGVHYPTDVLGGFVLGAAWVAIVAHAFDVAPWRRVIAAARDPSEWRP